MNDEPTLQQQPLPQQQQAPEEKDKLPVLGILSTVFGGLSMVPFLGVVSPLGLILGIIGLIKDMKKVMAIIGTSLSALGIATSPILWGLIACAIDPEGCKKEIEEEKQENSELLKEQLLKSDNITEGEDGKLIVNLTPEEDKN